MAILDLVQRGDTLDKMKNEQQDATQPAGYDSEGRPLYYEKPTSQSPRSNALISSKPTIQEGHDFNPQLRTQYAAEPDFVHARRELEPKVAEPSERLKRKHEECMRLYPNLNLSEGEYVILRISRHPIGLLIPVFFTTFAIVVLVTCMFLVPEFYDTDAQTTLFASLTPTPTLIIGVLGLLTVLSALIGGVAVWVYQRNRFFLTTESIIQEIQHSLFSRHEQTVSLGSIEDASFTRRGIFQHIFNYGTMRLSTEGEETTYTFAYVEDPKRQIAIVNNAVEAFKNGRPVDDGED